MKSRVVLLMSGGIDSTTVAHMLVKDGRDIHGVYNDLGMNHSKRERISVENIAAELSIPLTVVENRGSGRILETFGNPAFLDGGDTLDPDPPSPVIPIEMPKHRRPDGPPNPEEDPRAIGIYETIHPGCYIARSRGIEQVVLGTIADDIVYRPNFVESLDVLSKAYQLGDSTTDKSAPAIKFSLPLIDKSKAEVIDLAQTLGVDLQKTYSCLQGRVLHCGICVPCRSRRDAIKGVIGDDPTWYEAAPNIPQRSGAP